MSDGMRHRPFKCSVIVWGCLVATSTTGFAASNLPGAVEPGRIEKQFEQPPQPKSVPEIVVPEKVEQVPPAQAEKIRFTLVGIELEGATVYRKEDLFPLWEKLLGKEVSLLDIYKVADAITAHYRNAGYILTQAIVPPQKISNGIVRIQVVEGRVNEVLIEGDTQGRAELFQTWAEKIKASQPLDNSVLERYTLLANDLPGVSVKAVIRPSKAVSGASDVALVIEPKANDVSLTYDNRGTRTSGPFQANFSVGLNSLFKRFERTSASYISTSDGKELNYLALQHDQTLNAEGLKFTLNGNVSHSEPGDNLRALEVKSDNTTLGATVAYPVIRSRQKNLSVYGGMTLRNSKSATLGQPQSEDRIRAVKGGVSFDYADSLGGVNMVIAELHHGLNILNATETGSPLLSRADGRSDFTKLTFDLSRNQPLGERWGLLMAASGQYAASSLLASEEFGYGGSQYGRAYDSSEITGDHGIAAKLELQYTNQPAIPWFKYYQLYGFWDAGAVYGKSPTKADKRSGASAGFGVRFGLTDHLTGYLELAQPLTRPVSALNPDDQNKPRFFFSIAARF